MSYEVSYSYLNSHNETIVIWKYSIRIVICTFQPIVFILSTLLQGVVLSVPLLSSVER